MGKKVTVIIGEGAKEFAKPFLVGLPTEVAILRLEQLKAARLHDTTDKRVKRCGYFEYFYRDRTKPNNSKTCSKECKIKMDTTVRASKKPKKLTQVEVYYADEQEYSFWLDEQKMVNNTWKYEVPYSNKLEAIGSGQRQKKYYDYI
jgi:hypothetical protein